MAHFLNSNLKLRMLFFFFFFFERADGKLKSIHSLSLCGQMNIHEIPATLWLIRVNLRGASDDSAAGHEISSV